MVASHCEKSGKEAELCFALCIFYKRGDAMIDLSFVESVCNIMDFIFSIFRYIFSHKKQISHLLQQTANKLCDLFKKINHKKVSK